MSDIAAGRYTGRARPETMSFGLDSSGGDRIAVTFELTNDGFAGQSVPWFSSLKGGAIPITLRQLRDAGWSSDSLTDPVGLGDVEVPLDIYYEEWQGKNQMKVKVGRGLFEKPTTGSALKALDAKLKGAILQSKRPTAGAPAAPAWMAPRSRIDAAPRPAPAAREWDGQGADPAADPAADGPDDLPY